MAVSFLLFSIAQKQGGVNEVGDLEGPPQGQVAYLHRVFSPFIFVNGGLKRFTVNIFDASGEADYNLKFGE
jgi:hypothetical protein